VIHTTRTTKKPHQIPHENSPKIAPKIIEKEKRERQQIGDKEQRQNFHTYGERFST
jgi:hypothetical protein